VKTFQESGGADHRSGGKGRRCLEGRTSKTGMGT